MKSKAIGTTIIGSIMVMGGVDATQLNETPLEIQDTRAEEVVEVRQVENVVEATAPWKDQAGLTITYDMGEPTLTEKLKDERKEQVIYDRVDFGDGGFKVDILLYKKPDTNRFCYQIEGAENYDFFYQPELTPEEIAEGASRPPEIVGSYAVYHKTLKNHVIGQENYATGKVMHIPRPQVWELGNEDNKVWADLSYDAGQLCVTVPQDFLDKAAYPVRVDPTFGYTTCGATTNSFSSDWAIGNTATTSYSNSISSISACNSMSAGTGTFKATVNTNSGTFDVVDSAVGDVSSSVSGTTGVFYTSSFTSTRPGLTAGTAYMLSEVVSASGGNIRVHSDSVGSNEGWWDTVNSYASPASWGSRTLASATTRFSIYASFSVYVPTTTTTEVLNVGPRFATLSGSTTDPTLQDVSNYGFAYGTSPSLSGSDTATTSYGVLLTTNFRQTITGLEPNTTYYYRAYAVNTVATSTGSVLSFTTPIEHSLRINNGTLRINNGTLDL